MGSLDLETDPGRPARRVFVGFHYQAPYTALYGDRIREAVSRDGWYAVMPLGDDPCGLLLDRISVMIRSAERAVYELGADSGNIWFELGISLALRQPVVLTSDRQPSELVDILRTPWLSPYSTGDDCVEAVRGFLRLPDPQPMVPGRRASGDPTRVTVVGEGERADTVATVLRAAGRKVSTVNPASVRSPAEALEISESSGAIVAIRPPGVMWNATDAVAPLLMVGAAFGVGRNVVLAAGDSEAIPSDCTQLLVRASTPGALGEKVMEALDRSRPGPPPSGTMRPRITGALERVQATDMVEALSEAPAVALDAEPGYGKTTVLTQVAHQIQGPVAWVTLENDWSMPELVERLAAAVGEHAPGFGWKALAAIRQSTDDPSRSAPAEFRKATERRSDRTADSGGRRSCRCRLRCGAHRRRCPEGERRGRPAAGQPYPGCASLASDRCLRPRSTSRDRPALAHRAPPHLGGGRSAIFGRGNSDLPPHEWEGGRRRAGWPAPAEDRGVACCAGRHPGLARHPSWGDYRSASYHGPRRSLPRLSDLRNGLLHRPRPRHQGGPLPGCVAAATRCGGGRTPIWARWPVEDQGARARSLLHQRGGRWQLQGSQPLPRVPDPEVDRGARSGLTSGAAIPAR